MQFRSPSFSALSAALALAGAACTETPTTTLTDTENAIVALFVRPSEFIGDTPCGAAPGAMRSYVVTLVDRTYSDTCDEEPCQPPFTLASSLPTPCSAGVRFNEVVAAHSYTAYIDGYEESADQIWPQTICGDSVCRAPETADSCPVDCSKVPTCGDGKCRAFEGGSGVKETAVNCPLDCDGAKVDYKAMKSGSRHMQYADSIGKPASPRWLGTCGEGDQAKTLVALTGTTLLNACTPLIDGRAEPPESAVEIAPEDALGLLKCAADTGPGEVGVASFDIQSEDGLGDLLGIGCSDPPFVQRYTGDALVPGSTISFFIAARAQKGSDPVWGSECSAVVKDGLTVRAACAPLSDKGSLRIDIAAVLKELGVACSGDIASYDVSLTGGGIVKKAIPCTQSTTFGPLPPGAAAADMVIYTKDGTDLFTATCAAKVEAGRSTAADCTLN